MKHGGDIVRSRWPEIRIRYRERRVRLTVITGRTSEQSRSGNCPFLV